MSFFLVVQIVVPLEFDCVCLLFFKNTFVAKMELDQNLPLFYRRQMVVGKQTCERIMDPLKHLLDAFFAGSPGGCNADILH